MIKEKSKEIVGSRVYVEFPHDSGQPVLAKVDTGADYSAIWASDISERDGVLSFTLFDKGSQFYSGKQHQASTFSITQIKNSFGQSESRYKIPISVRVGGRRIRAEFTLADRSRNRYPVLIGKRTLSGKFLVDTQASPSVAKSSEQRVLMLNSIDSKVIKKFAQSLTEETPGLQCDFSAYDDLIIFLDGSEARVIRSSTGKDLELYDLVYFKTHYQRQEFAAALSEFFDSRATAYIDREISEHCSNTKITQYMRLWRKGLPIPKTAMINRSIMDDQYDQFVDLLGLPFILKDPEADKGLRNYLVKSRKQYNEIIRDTPTEQKYYVAQEFVVNSGDLRVVVLGRKVELVIGRQAQEGSDTHLNNTSTGGTAAIISPESLGSEIRNMAVSAAAALNRQVAGVDLIQDESTKAWYILEVNNSPQLASGAFVDSKIKVFGTFLRQFAKK